MGKNLCIKLSYYVIRRRYSGSDKGCILVDDMIKIIAEWNEMGGTGVQHIDSSMILNILNEIGILFIGDSYGGI